MIAKGKAISHGAVAVDYDREKMVSGKCVAVEIDRHELYSDTGAELIQEMKPYHCDFPNVKNNCLRFELSPAVEESINYIVEDWRNLVRDFIMEMDLLNHQYIAYLHTDNAKHIPHIHILVNRVSLDLELYNDSYIGRRATEVANEIGHRKGYIQALDKGLRNKAELRLAFESALSKMGTYSWEEFKMHLTEDGIKVREAINGNGKIFGYHVTCSSGTEYKASEIGREYTLSRLPKTYKKKVVQKNCKQIKAAKAKMGSSNFSKSAIKKTIKRVIHEMEEPSI